MKYLISLLTIALLASCGANLQTQEQVLQTQK